jgi:hypothetical protein
MLDEQRRITNVEPHTLRRTGGGWLAVSPSGARFSIGVTGPTEDEARERFCFTWNKWLETLSDTNFPQALDVPK